jgi:hypothetical protein
VGDARNRPVDQRGTRGCDEEVEGVQIAMGDRLDTGGRLAPEQVLAGSGELRLAEGTGVVGLLLDEPGGGGGDATGECVELDGERFGVEGVKRGRGVGELVREVAGERGDLAGDGGDAEPGHGWSTVDVVHHDQVPPERVCRRNRESNPWGWEVRFGDVPLDGCFPCAGGGVGDDSGDEVAAEPIGRIAQPESEHLGVEPARQWHRVGGEREVRPACRLA